MSTIALSTDTHIALILLIAFTSLAHLLVLNFKNPYKVRRYTRYLLPVFHVFIAANAFTGFIIMAMLHLPILAPRYILMIVATIALIALHIALNKALKWANPKDDEIFRKFKKRVSKIVSYEIFILMSSTLLLFYIV